MSLSITSLALLFSKKNSVKKSKCLQPEEMHLTRNPKKTAKNLDLLNFFCLANQRAMHFGTVHASNKQEAFCILHLFRFCRYQTQIMDIDFMQADKYKI